MIGYDDRRDHVRLWPALTLALGLLGVVLFARLAAAQNQPSDCSGTVGGTAAAITFGHPPTQYITIVNPSASATLWISTNGTAAANASGSFPLVGTGTNATLPPMPTLSIIASASSTPYTCFYR